MSANLELWEWEQIHRDNRHMRGWVYANDCPICQSAVARIAAIFGWRWET